MTTTRSAPREVLRTAYQKSVAAYWNAEKDPVNLRLGEVDGLYHHHYGIGEVDLSVSGRSGGDPRRERIIAEMHRLETAQAEVLLDHLGDVRPGDRLLDAGCGRGGTSIMANARFGCRVDGVSISEQQVAFANEQAARRGSRRPGPLPLHEHARHRLRDRGVPGHLEQREHDVRGPVRPVRRALPAARAFGGRYVTITGCYNDVTGGRSKAVAQIDQHYTCNIHPRSKYFRAMTANNLVPISRRRPDRPDDPVLGAAREVLGGHRHRGPVPHRVPRGQLPLPAHRGRPHLTRCRRCT
jgi:geranyl diphosphate 2-C-methyltransferase